MTMEPARHQLAAATKAVDAALKRTTSSEELARAALVAAAAAGDVVIPTPITLADLAERQIPEIGSIVYMTSYDEGSVVSARIAERDLDNEKFKLENPDAPGARIRGMGKFQWFGGDVIYASAAHAYFYLAQQAEDMRLAVEESIMTEQRLRDRCLAAAEDANVVATTTDQ
jgi:hypothetical protein